MAKCNTSYKTIDDAKYDYDAISVRHLSHQTVMRSGWGERGRGGLPLYKNYISVYHLTKNILVGLILWRKGIS